MKKTLFFLLSFSLLSISVRSQISFGISPGLNLNRAYLGYKLNPFISVFGGFQYLNVNGGATVQKSGYDSHTNQASFSGSLFVPNIGIKGFLYQKENVNGYVFGNIAKPFVKGKFIIDGVEQLEVKNEVDNISIYGGEIGYGMEYFFTRQFSIGGDFGLHFFHIGYKSTRSSSEYNSNTGKDEPVEYTYLANFNFNPTFSRVNFNFYF